MYITHKAMDIFSNSSYSPHGQKENCEQAQLGQGHLPPIQNGAQAKRQQHSQAPLKSNCKGCSGLQEKSHLLSPFSISKETTEKQTTKEMFTQYFPRLYQQHHCTMYIYLYQFLHQKIIMSFQVISAWPFLNSKA